MKTPELQRPADPGHAHPEPTFEFSHVCFGYNKSEVLRCDLSFKTSSEINDVVPIPSGSGKSTIAKLMAGFWDATSGIVLFDSQDIRNIPFDQLMGEISYVAQDNFLFDKTIRDNIRMGNPAATDEQIKTVGCKLP